MSPLKDGSISASEWRSINHVDLIMSLKRFATATSVSGLPKKRRPQSLKRGRYAGGFAMYRNGLRYPTI